MAAYRLFFLDRQGAIQAREDFAAADDAEALILASVVWEACSETYCGYELWSFGRRIVSAPDGIGMIPPPLLDALGVAHQERVLALEEAIRRSRWRAAKSEQLLQSIDALRARLEQQRRAVTAAALVDYAMKHGAERVTVQLAEPQGLRLVGSHGFDKPFLDYFAFVQDGDGSCCGAALRAQHQTVVPDIAVSPFFTEEPRAIVLGAGGRACVSTPLVAPGDGILRGMISFHYRKPQRPADGELARLEKVAQEMAATIADPTSAEAQQVRGAPGFI